MSEVKKILQDLANGVVDETLPRLTEEDIAFDMDEVVVEEEEFVDRRTQMMIVMTKVISDGSIKRNETVVSSK